MRDLTSCRLARRDDSWWRDPVHSADPAHPFDIEGTSSPASESPSGERSDNLVIALLRHALHQRDSLRGRAPRQRTMYDDGISAARCPINPDMDLLARRLRAQGDVGDQRAEQALTIFGGGGRNVPQPRKTSRQRLAVLPRRKRRSRAETRG